MLVMHQLELQWSFFANSLSPYSSNDNNIRSFEMPKLDASSNLSSNLILEIDMILKTLLLQPPRYEEYLLAETFCVNPWFPSQRKSYDTKLFFLKTRQT